MKRNNIKKDDYSAYYCIFNTSSNRNSLYYIIMMLIKSQVCSLYSPKEKQALKRTDLSQSWRCTSVIPAMREAEAEGSQVPGRLCFE
jgi:hypothetical protein